MDNLARHSSDNWIRTIGAATDPKLRLVCCPHAGASASAYRALSATLPDSVETLSVQYPGRSGNRSETAITVIEELAEHISSELLPWSDRPLAVFGHSMGSAVAFEVTRRLTFAGVRPQRLFVSGRPAPSAGLGPNIPRNDEEIVAELKAMGAVPEKLFDRPNFVQSILTVIKSDYQANSSYSAAHDAMVDCPITFLRADDDPYLTPEAASGWQGHTSAEFRTVRFPGGHFFFEDQLPDVVGEMLHDLRFDPQSTR